MRTTPSLTQWERKGRWTADDSYGPSLSPQARRIARPDAQTKEIRRNRKGGHAPRSRLHRNQRNQVERLIRARNPGVGAHLAAAALQGGQETAAPGFDGHWPPCPHRGH